MFFKEKKNKEEVNPYLKDYIISLLYRYEEVILYFLKNGRVSDELKQKYKVKYDNFFYDLHIYENDIRFTISLNHHDYLIYEYKNICKLVSFNEIKEILSGFKLTIEQEKENELKKQEKN